MLRRLYDYFGNCVFADSVVLSEASGLKCNDKSLAVQSQKDEADINVLVKRFGITGQMPVGVRVPTYGDFLNAPDNYVGALNAVMAADAAFMRMPAAIRARFDNSPALFVEFCSDPSNMKEMLSMGLAVEVPGPSVAPVVPEVKPSGTSG